MARPSSKRRPLTDAECAASDALRAAVDAYPGSQEELAAKVGVSQGLIWQWASRKLAVPAHRAEDLADALGESDPGRFSLEYAELLDRALSRVNEGSTDYLSVRERTLLENYRAAPEGTKDVVDAAAAAGAKQTAVNHR